MGEWIVISKDAYYNLIRGKLINRRMNTRDYGRVKLLWIFSKKRRGRHASFKNKF